MPLKPGSRILLMLGAMICAFLLSYTILMKMQPSDLTDMETRGQKETPAAAGDSAAPVPAAEEGTAEGARSRQTLPVVRFYDGAGQPVTLEDFSGEVLLVNLWATWCPPCIAELPSLDRLQALLKDEGLHVVAISLDRKPVAEIAEFLAARKVEQIELYVDSDRQIPLKWRYDGVPASFLVSRDGEILETYAGPREWTEGEVFARIRAALTTPPPPAPASP